MRERGAEISQAAEGIRACKAATRDQVRRIQEAQKAAMGRADLMGDILTVVKAGLSIYGAATKPDTGETRIDIKVDQTVIEYRFDTSPSISPDPPVELPAPI